jgi:citrate lyase beta subunit
MELLLFVPAYQERFIKSARTLQSTLPGVRVVFDLEDGCPPSLREQGRIQVLAHGTRDDLYRFSWEGEDLARDLAVIPGEATLVVPKAHQGRTLERPSIYIIETAEGLEDARLLGQCGVGLIVGLGDLMVEFQGSSMNEYARQRVLGAGRAAGVPVYDSPTGTLAQAAIAGHARDSYLHGFDGVVVLHPVEAKLTYDWARPTQVELDRARAMVNETEAVHLTEGSVVGPPQLKQAAALLRRWDHGR